ncbi:MAG: nitrate transporter permease [Hyphomicrobiales bacterium]|nr:nitrate transporter permease [Hyphomicrobiales bacterium]
MKKMGPKAWSLRRRQVWSSRLTQAGFILVLLSLWYGASNHWGVNALLLPKPQLVWAELVDILRTGEFWPDLLLTLSELAGAFTISLTLGLVVGFLVSLSPALVKVFEPLIAGVYAVPIILFLPLFVLFFGLGAPSKIALGATISFFPIVLNTIAGFVSVDRICVTAARSMGASPAKLVRYVLVPGALPVILTGLRMGFTIALLAIIGSETIASLAGIGHRIVQMAEAMETARMFAYIVFVIVIAASLNALVSSLEKRGAARR